MSMLPGAAAPPSLILLSLLSLLLHPLPLPACLVAVYPLPAICRPPYARHRARRVWPTPAHSLPRASPCRSQWEWRALSRRMIPGKQIPPIPPLHHARSPLHGRKKGAGGRSCWQPAASSQQQHTERRLPETRPCGLAPSSWRRSFHPQGTPRPLLPSPLTRARRTPSSIRRLLAIKLCCPPATPPGLSARFHCPLSCDASSIDSLRRHTCHCTPRRAVMNALSVSSRPPNPGRLATPLHPLLPLAVPTNPPLRASLPLLTLVRAALHLSVAVQGNRFANEHVRPGGA